MKKVVALLGLLSISLTLSTTALAVSTSRDVSQKALGILIKNSRVVKLTGDTRDDGSEKVYDVLAKALVSGLTITNTCAIETDTNLKCDLMISHEMGETNLMYRVKIEQGSQGLNVIGLDSRFVEVSRGT
ncbi:hypothetical protein [Bdellovibrio sp. HCB2-146]|uniref:hypothetical protein n=1 Tax=Bdellovibrio sp. HCB2-146 TaxID=3394362 RepID=UPI0039BD7F26